MKYKFLILLLIGFISCKMDNHKSIKQEKKINKSIDTVFFDEQGDTIKPQTAYLRNNYKLIIFPALDKKNQGVINFRLINRKKDNTYLLASTFPCWRERLARERKVDITELKSIDVHERDARASRG